MKRMVSLAVQPALGGENLLHSTGEGREDAGPGSSDAAR